MKKFAIGSSIFLALLLVLSSFAMAGSGFGPGQKPGDFNPGDGPVHDILSGEPFYYENVTVVTIIPGGIEVQGDAYGDDPIAVYGIGPVRYWYQLGVMRPQVGETITVEGYTVSYTEEISRNVATLIIIGEQEVPLRDPDTGRPLWRGAFRNEQDPDRPRPFLQ